MLLAREASLDVTWSGGVDDSGHPATLCDFNLGIAGLYTSGSRKYK